MNRRKEFVDQERKALRVDFDAPGSRELDDVAIGGDHIHLVRLESMGSGHMWGGIILKDGRCLRLSITAERRDRIRVTGEWE